MSWPIGCEPGETCTGIGYPDTDGDGTAFNCGPPGYPGHQGTDIMITWSQLDAGVPVFAAADGTVQWVFDGKYDRCPDPNEPDCQAPLDGWFVAGQSNGYRVCTRRGPFCGTGTCCCFWCFDGGNVVVILHDGVPGVFATRYDHLRKGSILVTPGERVRRGQQIALVGSAGHSTGPHLHFEVWGGGFYNLADPWAGPCGPNTGPSLWRYDPPWQQQTAVCPDSDMDGHVDCSTECLPAAGDVCGDNCPNTPNPDQQDINDNGRGDACELLPVSPADGTLFTRSDPAPTFTWNAGGMGYFRVELSTSQQPFVPMALKGTKKSFKHATSWVPSRGTWDALEKLASDGRPVFWRIAGRARKNDAVGTLYSSQIFAFSVGP